MVLRLIGLSQADELVVRQTAYVSRSSPSLSFSEPSDDVLVQITPQGTISGSFVRNDLAIENGEEILEHLDRIQWLDESYRVLLESTSTTIESSLRTSLNDELSCPLCLDLLVRPTTLVPCGHSFCQECIFSGNNCPTCRASVRTHVPCLALAGTLETLLPLLEADDVAQYKERRGPPEAEVLVVPWRKTKRKRARGGATAEQAICID